MINNYFTLRALVRTWAPDLAGCVLGDAFSQVKDELTLAFASPAGAEWTVRCSVRRPLLYVFRSTGYHRARRNVATLFGAARGRRVEAVRLAERDRMIFFDLEGGLHVQMLLFGGRANVLLVDAEGHVAEAFRTDAHAVGKAAPAPRPAPLPETFAAFEARWKASRNTTAQALSSALPLLDRTLADEVAHRAEVAAGDPPDYNEHVRRRLFDVAQHVLAALRAPAPRIYWDARGFPEAFSLIDLTHRADDAEPFDTVDEAARVYVRRRLAAAHFGRLYDPLEEALAEAAAHHRTSAERMLGELQNESRAARYERWGHLLMAAPAHVPAGAEEVRLADLFSEEAAPVTIPLDPALSAVENAEHYYDRARRTRRARAEAERGLVETEAQAREAGALLAALPRLDTLAGIKEFRKAEAERLAPFMRDGEGDLARVPFRRFVLRGGYEVWVGKSARQNDDLTFHHAQKYDLWMHARDLPGAPAVLRLPARDAEPPRHVVQQAASIAAYYSKGRGSKLVPVIVARRKHVRSPKGAPAGAVRVEHEQDALLVAPRLPG